MTLWMKCRKKPIIVEFRYVVGKEIIHTLEGDMTAIQGKHYIIRGVKGEQYPIEKAIFFETYDVEV